MPPPGNLYIDVQHGLCNRLRAMASAATVAAALDRRLVVIWRPDHHCEARLSDLLSYDGPVVEDESADDLRRVAARVYNYMEIEAGSEFQKPIEDTPGGTGDIYIRSAYSLTGPLTDRLAERRFVRALTPSEAVVDLVRSVPRPSRVAAHIRMATGPQFDALPWESPANWPQERHRELIEWRRKSDVARFVARLDALSAAGEADTIFVAADLAATYSVLLERYGTRLRYLPRTDFDRSPRQLQYALADLILLSAAPRLLASTYSSFSDTAIWLTRGSHVTERSGIDF